MPDHGLGRLPKTHDARDGLWPPERLEALIERGIAAPIDWTVPRILDQGQNGTCVAAGILGALNSDDENHVDPGFTSADIVPFFLQIPGHGDLPGGGAEVRNGLKQAKTNDWLLAYSALTTQATIISWLEHHGPVVWGTDWYTGMMETDANGVVHVTGTIAGGHCYFGNGDLSAGDFDDVQSWGDWGPLHGHFRIPRAEFITKLLNNGGEAWALVQPAPTPPSPTPKPKPDPNVVKGWIADLKALLKYLEGLLK